MCPILCGNVVADIAYILQVVLSNRVVNFVHNFVAGSSRVSSTICFESQPANNSSGGVIVSWTTCDPSQAVRLTILSSPPYADVSPMPFVGAAPEAAPAGASHAAAPADA